MAYSAHTFELTLPLNGDSFEKLLSVAYSRAKGSHRMFEKKDAYHDQCLDEEGIKISFHRGQYKKKIKLIVNPSRMLGGSDLKLWKPNKDNTRKLLKKLDGHIENYFDGHFHLDDFTLSRIDFTVNLDVGSRKNVSAYIKVLHKLGKVKGFSRAFDKNDDRIDHALSFDLEGNSNGIGFSAYDKEAQLGSKNVDTHLIRQAKGILRLEVRLKKKKAICKYTEAAESSGQLIDLARQSEGAFLDTFRRIVPPGDHYKMKDAVAIIETGITKPKQRERMLELMSQVSKKKSLLLAQKALKVRDVDKIMSMFTSLNLSPITVGKRQDVKKLKSLYCYLNA